MINPYESPTSSGSEKNNNRVLLAVIAVTVGGIGGGLAGIYLASAVLRPQIFPGTGPSEGAMMLLSLLVMVIGGVIAGAVIGRKLVQKN